MYTSPFLNFDDGFPPTVMLGESPVSDIREDARWAMARLLPELTARLRAWATAIAVCAAVGFFSGAVIAKLNESLQPRPAPVAASAPQPAPAMESGQIPFHEPFGMSWPVAVDIEPALPAAPTLVSSTRAFLEASAAPHEAQPSAAAQTSGSAGDSPLQTLLVVLGALGALDTAAVGAVNNWFSMLH